METDRSSFAFDVFLSHASEDKAEVRTFVKNLRTVGISVWLDEERLPPGVEPQRAVSKGMASSRHVLVWVTSSWLKKSWTTWELELFREIKSKSRKVIPVLQVQWKNDVLGPYLSKIVAIPPDIDAKSQLWLTICGIHDLEPGPKENWKTQGLRLIAGEHSGSLKDGTAFVSALHHYLEFVERKTGWIRLLGLSARLGSQQHADRFPIEKRW